MDSGATKHVILHRAAFDIYEAIAPRNIHFVDDIVVKTIGMGSMVLETIMRDKFNRLCIKDAVYVPKLQVNLLSVSWVALDGLKVSFKLIEYIGKTCNGRYIAIAPYEGTLYVINFTKVYRATNLVQSLKKDDALELWHRRLAHWNMKGVHMI